MPHFLPLSLSLSASLPYLFTISPLMDQIFWIFMPHGAIFFLLLLLLLFQSWYFQRLGFQQWCALMLLIKMERNYQREWERGEERKRVGSYLMTCESSKHIPYRGSSPNLLLFPPLHLQTSFFDPLVFSTSFNSLHLSLSLSLSLCLILSLSPLFSFSSKVVHSFFHSL